ncbi:OCT domain-containing protein OS=Streptomyces microflavus OX=1919 GN=Smic_23800 PE=4 SV=1 [Streptomyces microflavus]
MERARFNVGGGEKPAAPVRSGAPAWHRLQPGNGRGRGGYLADRLNRLGVEDALDEGGRPAGDGVAIGPEENAVVFDWEPTVTAGAEMLGRRGEDHRLEEPRPAAQRRRDRDSERDDAEKEYDEFDPF